MDFTTDYGTTEIESKSVIECERSESNKLQHTFVPKQFRIQLAEVKTNLYNPVRNTLRRYDMDNVQGKLSDEHSRNTLPPGLVTLPSYNENKVDPPQIICPGYDLLSLPFNTSYQEKIADELSLKKNKDMSNSWKIFLESMPLTKTNMVQIPKNK